MRLAVALPVVIAIAAATAVRASACEIPGYAERWALASCFYQHETDDELHPGVLECFDAWRSSRSNDDCVEKHVLKTRLCENRLRWSDDHDSVAECVADDTFVPDVVKHGVGG